MDGERGKALVEEVEIERETHAEGMDARAARNEQSRTGLRTVEEGEAKQAGAEAGGDGNLPAERGRNREVLEARRSWTDLHAVSRPPRADLSPVPNAVAGSIKVQTLFQREARAGMGLR
jgi:hypothetical protein